MNAVQLIKQCTLLYAESNEKVAKDILTLYHALFKDVHYASNGQEALDLYEQHKQSIDIIITDVELSVLSGIEFVQHIRQKDGYKLPVIFSTNTTNDDVMLQCLKLGTADFIIKPIQHKTHLGILIKVLRPIYDLKLVHVINQELDIYQTYANSQLLISKTDVKGRITYANELFYKVSGYTKQEVIGKSHNIVRHKNMPNEIFEDLWQTITAGEIWEGHIQNRSKSGHSYYVDAKIFPIKDNENNIVEFMSFRQDVTSHIASNNKAKDALKQTKLNYSKIYNEAIEKAKKITNKNLVKLEQSAKIERENAQAEMKKHHQIEKLLQETTQRKNEEIDKWKERLKEAGKLITSISTNNKKLSADMIVSKNTLEVVKEKLQASQDKIANYDIDKAKLLKIIDNKDDVILHLEDELAKLKGKKRDNSNKMLTFVLFLC